MLRSGPLEAESFRGARIRASAWQILWLEWRRCLGGVSYCMWRPAPRTRLLPWPAKQTWLTRSTSATIVTRCSGVCVEGNVCESRSFEKFSTTVPLLYCTCKLRRGGGSLQRSGFTPLSLQLCRQYRSLPLVSQRAARNSDRRFAVRLSKWLSRPRIAQRG